jgi:hypothetical protein
MLVKIFLFLSIIICGSMAQSRHLTDSATVTICWTGTADTSAKYLVYYRTYGDAVDTLWRAIGTTKVTQLTFSKTNKKMVAFGVRTIIGNDTSEMHSSLDSTACATAGPCDACATLGSWYLIWKIKRPIKMNEKK